MLNTISLSVVIGIKAAYHYNHDTHVLEHKGVKYVGSSLAEAKMYLCHAVSRELNEEKADE